MSEAVEQALEQAQQVVAIVPEVVPPTPEKAKRKISAIKQARASIEKQVGKEALVTWSDLSKLVLPRESTGSAYLDEVLGGGLVRGRLHQFFGPESGGKTAVSTHIAGHFLKQGKTVGYIEPEQAFDPSYAKKTFEFDVMNEDQVLFSQEQLVHNVYTMIESMVESGIDLIIVDSTDAMMSEAEDEGEHGDAHIGQLARAHSISLKKILKRMREQGTILIFISQVRDKIGGYGGGETTSGGRAIKFYSTIRARISKREGIKLGDNTIGQIIKVMIYKNKTAPPFKEAELTLYYGKGFDTTGELIDRAVALNLMEKGGGGYFTFHGETEGQRMQGKDNLVQYLKDHPDILERLRLQVVEKQQAQPVVG